jgi:CPA2 family monovalent cation:H+ antiporter-2
LGVAVALAQIGEFSLILAAVAQQLNIFPPAAANLIVAASIVSLTLNPLQYKTLGWMERMLAVFNRRSQGPEESLDRSIPEPGFRAIVVGYGPIGKTLARLLHDGGIEPTIVEANLETSRLARADGHKVVYGDAGNMQVLEAAGIRTAAALILSASTTNQNADIVKAARQANPAMRVIARANYLRETHPISSAGADAVFAGEGEVALAMSEHILGMLGATPEQIDRERLRVRQEVFPKPER